MPRIVDPRNTTANDESVLAYLEHRNRLLIEQQKQLFHQQQQQQSLLEQVKFINKCSSYIDRKEQYQFANMLVNHQVTKGSKNNIKKLGQCISNKLKKLIHLNSSLSSANKSNEPSENPIRLINFNYKESTTSAATVESSSSMSARKLTRKSTMRLAAVIAQSARVTDRTYHFNNQQQQHHHQQVVTKSRTSLHSNGSSSSSSSASSSSSCRSHDCGDSGVESYPPVSDLLSSRLDLINTLPHMGTSTPMTSSRLVDYRDNLGGGCEGGVYASTVRPAHNHFDNEDDRCYCDECVDCCKTEQAINMALYLDQSTQVPVDSPVLIESTFNNSSLSNLSDDLIIVQQTQVHERTRPLGFASAVTPRSVRKPSFQPSSNMRSSQLGVPPPPRGVSLSRNITPWL